MKFAIAILTGYYLIVALRLFQVWSQFLRRDTDMSPQQRRFSWGVLMVGIVFWPLVVPISYLTLLKEKLAKKAAGEIETPRESSDRPLGGSEANRLTCPEMVNSGK